MGNEDKMENNEKFLQDIDDFRNAVKQLSDHINKAKVNWKDEQFENLSKTINEIASSSKDVLESGKLCERELKRFNTIVK